MEFGFSHKRDSSVSKLNFERILIYSFGKAASEIAMNRHRSTNYIAYLFPIY